MKCVNASNSDLQSVLLIITVYEILIHKYIDKNILKIDCAYYMPSEIIQNSEFVIREIHFNI